MTRPDYIVCCPVANAVAKGSYIVPGSLTASCIKCGQPVLVSPSSLEVRQDNPDAQFLCMECALISMEKIGGEIIEFTPAQIQELDEYRRQKL